MAVIGTYNNLGISRLLDFGVMLDGGDLGEILLPNKFTPEDAKLGDKLDVFVYLDAENRLIATTQKAKAQVGQFAFLKVVGSNRAGSFLDWGLPKDLMVHVSNQVEPMRMGESYLVYVYYDEHSGHLSATAKINKYLDLTMPVYKANEAVDLIITDKTDIGFKAIVNHQHWGVVHFSDVFKPLRYGQSMRGYIRKVRDDDKIDLQLQPPGYGKVDAMGQKILNKLKSKGGFLPLNDKSAPDLIYQTFGMSKKVFKQAIGGLYKQRLIRIEKDGIHQLDE